MNRDETLATFMEITKIDDFGVAMSILEAHDWDLNNAVHFQTPAVVQPGEDGIGNASPPVDIIEAKPDNVEVFGGNIARKAGTKSVLKTKAVASNGNLQAGSSSSSVSSRPIDSASDDIVHVDDLPPPKRRAVYSELLPPMAENNAETIQIFQERFSELYGPPSPLFYIGSLQEAMKEAFDHYFEKRRLLIIYLHHQKSICINVFVTHILQDDSIWSMMADGFVIWPWDCSTLENRQRLKSVFNRLSLDIPPISENQDAYPLLFVIEKRASRAVMSSYIVGNQSKEEVKNALNRALADQARSIEEERVGEIERVEREQERVEQDEAFKASLAADREKDRKKAEEEENARLVEEAEKRKEEEARILQQKVNDSLPEEPPSNCTEPILNCRFNFPTGERVTRRFLNTDKLSCIINFAHAKGYAPDVYCVKSTYPTKDLTKSDLSQQIGFYNLGKSTNLLVDKH